MKILWTLVFIWYTGSQPNFTAVASMASVETCNQAAKVFTRDLEKRRAEGGAAGVPKWGRFKCLRLPK